MNPDGVDVFMTYAKQCSTDKYDLEVQQAARTRRPTSAPRLARRLAAEDSSTDLMNLDPVFVAEFANAGWLKEVTGEVADEVEKSVEGNGNYLSGAADTVTWNDKVYAIPLWANTQVLWYRKSLAKAAGLDMTKPVTWDQVIDAAKKEGGTVGVQANKYEAYVVWINALVQGAGGDIVSDTEARRDAKVDIDSDAGRKAAAIIQKAGRQRRPAGPDRLERGHQPGSDVPQGGAGRVHDQLDLRLPELRRDRRQARRHHQGAGWPTSAGRATPRRSRARHPSRRSAASTSASGPTPSTPTGPRKRLGASPRRRRRSTSRSRPD
ncbi:extracellular solute-binding protein [Nocardioides sp. W3-2-3]|uniref:extracellular solute-binding protein n=1 Tax=Nocardioides convexus TaxID=2712224 RepID=UPI0024183400|nr:extracellular solute-binding protein [Nocardioides convexus]NHA01620.1 extracellular solute-binding protein [Nocardioides convexus]